MMDTKKSSLKWRNHFHVDQLQVLTEFLAWFSLPVNVLQLHIKKPAKRAL